MVRPPVYRAPQRRHRSPLLAHGFAQSAPRGLRFRNPDAGAGGRPRIPISRSKPDRVGEDPPGRGLGLGAPLGPLGGQLARAHDAVVAHDRDLPALVRRHVVEAHVPRPEAPELAQTAAAGRVPGQDGPVEGARHQPGPVRRPVEGALPLRGHVLERGLALEGRRVPDLDLLVVGGRQDVAGARTRRDLLDARPRGPRSRRPRSPVSMSNTRTKPSSSPSTARWWMASIAQVSVSFSKGPHIWSCRPDARSQTRSVMSSPEV